MMHKSVAIIALTSRGIALGKSVQSWLRDSGSQAEVVSPRDDEGVTPVSSVSAYVERMFRQHDAFIFIGALGITVRAIAPFLGNKQIDPAVVNCDENALFVQAVLSGHKGGANELSLRLSRFLGAQPVLSTSSDVQGLWPLDILGRDAGWSVEPKGNRSLSFMMADFVNHKRTALLLDVRDRVTDMLERTVPDFVDVYFDYDTIPFDSCSLLLAVTPRIYNPSVPAVFYRPKVLCVGVGCEKGIDPEGFMKTFETALPELGYSPRSLHSIASIDLKSGEPAFNLLAERSGVPFNCFSREELETVPDVPTPSETVMRKIGTPSVAEASAALLAGDASWLVPKRKYALPGVEHAPRYFTLSASLLAGARRRGRIAIVGAGPGDPELITLRGRRYLEQADLVLYAGSLVPEKLTHAAKPGALVRSSADMALEEQIELMQQFCRTGRFVVRLHTGDPSIYGAIQEQMELFDELGLPYEIVPGVSSFQAAAAALRTEFTIPETVQTIILTRGEGRTPVPEKERLSELARSTSTMCIYLSAGIVRKVQDELLQHYPPHTPVAACYRLTRDDQEILRGELSGLGDLVSRLGKSNTVLLVVGVALQVRGKRSKLYHPVFSHGFRAASEATEAEP
jgi:precorrin-4 C11-methyltransferase